VDCRACELYFHCGGHDICPYMEVGNVEDIAGISFDELCEITGASCVIVDNLLKDGFFGELYSDEERDEYGMLKHKQGCFDFHAIDVLNDYLDEEL